MLLTILLTTVVIAAVKHMYIQQALDPGASTVEVIILPISPLLIRVSLVG